GRGRRHIRDGDRHGRRADQPRAISKLISTYEFRLRRVAEAAIRVEVVQRAVRRTGGQRGTLAQEADIVLQHAWRVDDQHSIAAKRLRVWFWRWRAGGSQSGT